MSECEIDTSFIFGNAQNSDMDAIVNGGVNTYTLVAISDCALFSVDDEGLRTFFRHNPGILLSMVNQHYII